MTTTKGKTSTTTFTITLLLISYALYSLGPRVGGPLTLQTALLVLAGLSLVSIFLIILARTTMVAWITVLVVLAFSGKQRRVLAHNGRKITADVAMDVIKTMIKEGKFVTVICATLVSLMAVSQVTRS